MTKNDGTAPRFGISTDNLFLQLMESLRDSKILILSAPKINGTASLFGISTDNLFLQLMESLRDSKILLLADD